MYRMILALTLLAGAPAFADERGAPPDQMQKEFGEHHVDRMIADLGLDATTAARVRATWSKHHDQLAPIMKDAWQTRSALEEAVAAAQPDERKIVQLTDKLTNDRQQLMTLHGQLMADLKQQLTPVQYARLLLEMGPGGHHGMGHHGRHAPNP